MANSDAERRCYNFCFVINLSEKTVTLDLPANELTMLDYGLTLYSHSNSSIHLLKDEALVGELNALGVHFLSGGDGRQQIKLPPTTLLAGLATSGDTRVQLALIPLLLVQPTYAQKAHLAAQQLQGYSHILFCCYYTAAVYLQRREKAALQAVQLRTDPLPNLFAATLDLSRQDDYDQALCTLAIRQQQLLQDTTNWLGAYEHALQRLLRRRRLEQQWSR